MKRSSNISFFSIFGILLFLIVSFPVQSSGQNGEDKKKRSKEFFERGIILFKSKDYKGALENFQSSFELYPHPNLKYNLGVCLFFLKKYAEAGNYLEAFLLEEGGHTESAIVQKSLSTLAEIRSRVGLVYINVNIPGAEIRIDGEACGNSPLDSGLYVEPGSHEIKASGSTGKVWKGMIDIKAGETKMITITLAGEPEADETKEIQASKKDIDEEKHEKKDRGKPARGFFYASLALAVASAIGGGVSGGIAMKKADELDDLDRDCLNAGCDNDLQAHNNYLEKADDLYHDAEDAGKASTALFVVSGAAAIAGLVMFFIARPFKKANSRHAASFPSVVVGESEWLLSMNF